MMNEGGLLDEVSLSLFPGGFFFFQRPDDWSVWQTVRVMSYKKTSLSDHGAVYQVRRKLIDNLE